MRTVTYGGAVSLDGFLAGVDGSIDWMHFSKDVQEVMAEYWKDVDTILMGRKTYEVAAAQGRAGKKNPKKAKRRTEKEAMRSYVFSAGIPTFRDPRHRVKLTLKECRRIEGGFILANYKVLHAE